MKPVLQHCKTLSLATAAALLVAVPVMAEDIEIYLTSSLTASEVRPNITFVIDTSGSMGTEDVPSPTAAASYDPATTYSGSCDAGRVYWSTTSRPPSCGTSQYLESGANKCKASFTALAGASGYYNDRFAQHNGRSGSRSRWVSLSTSEHSLPIECQADWGVHGETDASTAKYPQERTSTRWTSDSSAGISWAGTGGTYTLYSGNYLNWRASSAASAYISRLDSVKLVFTNLINSLGSNVNLAIMRYDARSASYNKGGYFVMPMQRLTDANRADYIAAVNAFSPAGYTPLAETLYEAYLYYRGGNVLFGNSSTPGTNVSGVLDPSNTSKYKSPIEYQCQKNFVVFLTDGEPTYDTDADAAIKALPEFSTVTGSSTCSGDCMDELAQYMNNKDCRADLGGDQKVSTYTIGFGADVVHTPPATATAAETLLLNTANKGGGKFYTATSTTDLADVFNNIIIDILAVNSSFTAPAVSVNAFNRSTHRDELYFALFLPSNDPKWYGNIKRFKLGTSDLIVDANGVDAVNPATGFFKSTATSFWTPAADAPDGDSAKKGGAASKLSLPRNAYTYTGSGAPSNVNLAAAAHTLNESNTALTKAMLGDAAMSDDRRTDILKWARGIDLLDEDNDGDTSDARRFMGAALHAKPLLITYGGTSAAPDITLYASTGEGKLHAIDTDDGTEMFSFTPQELLPNLATLYDNTASVSVIYGLDGPLTTWISDANGNGSIGESGDFAYLYQGMRRGGRNYYAFDVTNRSAPTLKWLIKGGTGDFTELAQSWSAALKTKIKYNGADKTVLIFGGGYDTAQDSNSTVADDTVGRAIFIVDAETGARLWQAGPSGSGATQTFADMKYSIPSDVTILDANGDGYSDRLYVGDMGGQIWRFDLKKVNSGASDLATGGVIASLGDSTASGNRRFYYAPDVSMATNGKYFNLAIGSGYREHPLNTTIHDALFVIHDRYVSGPQRNSSGEAVYTKYTLSDLYDATSNLIGQGTASEIVAETALLATKHGLYIWLNESGSFIGEKVLAKSVTVGGMVMFTTYTPTSSGVTGCAPSQGVSYLYYISTTDGTPGTNLTGDATKAPGDPTLVRADRRKAFVRGGIHSTPTILVQDTSPDDPDRVDTEMKCIADTEECGPPLMRFSPSKTIWRVQ
ncbi:MAG: pilus assembly protein PilY [Pseudomonadota bacterium]